MHPSSTADLQQKFGNKLFEPNYYSNNITVSYLLANGLTSLTSRITRVLATNGKGDMCEYKVYVETRYCRHRITLTPKDELPAFFTVSPYED
jgi:hypothetical protein